MIGGMEMKKMLNNGKQFSIFIAILLLIAGGGAGVTLAYLSSHSALVNQFEVGTVTTQINEEFDGKEKKNVSVTNSGNIPVYVRVAITIWEKDVDGNLLWSPYNPENLGSNTGLSFDMTNDTNWVKGIDGYYYYILPVKAEGKTTDLITSCKANDNWIVDINVQSIQSNPIDAVKEAWTTVTHVDSDGKLTINTTGGGV